jgi:hypothetical protein
MTTKVLTMPSAAQQAWMSEILHTLVLVLHTLSFADKERMVISKGTEVQ